MTYKIRGAPVAEYAYYVNKLRQNVGLESEYDVKLWHHKQRTPNTNDHHMPLNETLNWHYCSVEDFIQSLNGLRTELHATNKYVHEQADSCLTQMPKNKCHDSN